MGHQQVFGAKNGLAPRTAYPRRQRPAIQSHTANDPSDETIETGQLAIRTAKTDRRRPSPGCGHRSRGRW